MQMFFWYSMLMIFTDEDKLGKPCPRKVRIIELIKGMLASDLSCEWRQNILDVICF